PIYSRLSFRSTITAYRTLFTQYPLPQLDIACAGGTGTGEQVITPHPQQAVAELLGKRWPCVDVFVMPGHKCFIILLTEVMYVFQHKIIFQRLVNLADRGQLSIGENITVQPRVGCGVATVLANGVQ